MATPPRLTDELNGSTLQFVLGYIGRRWAPVPVPFRKKGPVLRDLAASHESAPRYFNRGRKTSG
jgi:hypothetical protein